MTQQDVLIVDDEPQMLIAMNETVKRTGFSIATAGSGVEALEKIKKCHYRMVITDLRMPVVSGLDVHALRAFGAHAIDYLLKPFSADDLQSVVQRAIQ